MINFTKAKRDFWYLISFLALTIFGGVMQTSNFKWLTEIKGITIVIFIGVLGKYLTSLNNRELKFKKICQSTEELSPEYFGIKNYNHKYIFRESDNKILNYIFKENKDVLICGRSGIGKSRSAYEAIKKLKGYIVVKINKFINIEDLDNINEFRKDKNIILFIDMIDGYMESLINGITDKLGVNCKVIKIATCRKNKIDNDTFEIVELKDISIEDAINLNDDAKLDLINLKFDGTPNSVILLNNKNMYKKNKSYNKIFLFLLIFVISSVFFFIGINFNQFGSIKGLIIKGKDIVQIKLFKSSEPNIIQEDKTSESEITKKKITPKNTHKPKLIQNKPIQKEPVIHIRGTYITNIGNKNLRFYATPPGRPPKYMGILGAGQRIFLPSPDPDKTMMCVTFKKGLFSSDVIIQQAFKKGSIDEVYERLVE